MIPTLYTLLACSQSDGWKYYSADSTTRYEDTADSGALHNQPALPALGDLVITEVMKNPAAVDDTVGEWMEIANTTDHDISLLGLALQDDDHDPTFLVDDALVPAFGHAVLGPEIDSVLNGGVAIDASYSNDEVALSNSEGRITLLAGDLVLDQVSYDNGDAYPDDEGYSLSLDPSQTSPTANDDGKAWCEVQATYGVAGDHGTPGADNPPCAESAPRRPEKGELVIDEFMRNPDPTDDDYGEWIEIVNVSTVELSLDEVAVRDDDGESFALAATLLPGDYLVVAASSDHGHNGGVTPDLVWPAGAFHLSNDADEIVLQLDSTELDAVRYDGSFPDDPGRSTTLGAAAFDATSNDDEAAWCNADTYYGTDANRGTPGALNDLCE